MSVSSGRVTVADRGRAALESGVAAHCREHGCLHPFDRDRWTQVRQSRRRRGPVGHGSRVRSRADPLRGIGAQLQSVHEPARLPGAFGGVAGRSIETQGGLRGDVRGGRSGSSTAFRALSVTLNWPAASAQSSSAQSMSQICSRVSQRPRLVSSSASSCSAFLRCQARGSISSLPRQTRRRSSSWIRRVAPGW